MFIFKIALEHLQKSCTMRREFSTHRLSGRWSLRCLAWDDFLPPNASQTGPLSFPLGALEKSSCQSEGQASSLMRRLNSRSFAATFGEPGRGFPRSLPPRIKSERRGSGAAL